MQTSKTRRPWATLVALTLTLASPSALAQQAREKGDIVIDAVSAETRRPLADVTAVATSRAGERTENTADDSGRVQLGPLAPGLYSVAISGNGRITVVEPSVRVVARKAIPLRVELVAMDDRIEEVTVVARALQADAFGAASNAYLNREELRSAVGAGSDVMRALDGLPGLVSTGDFANFSVRGRGPRDNLIFVDGLPLDKVVHFDQTLGEEEDIGGGGRFSIFAPNSIAGAEFSPGGWSAAFGGRAGSLLQLDVAGGSSTPTATMRVDIAGVELGYEGPSLLRDDTTVFMTARRFDFGRVFDFIDEKDIGQPVLTDFIFKSVTDYDDRNTFEILTVLAPEKYTRDIENVLASENFDDTAVLRSEQDLGLVGLSWKRLVGDNAEWTNRLYYRNSDKTSAEGEAFPDLVAADTPPADIPVRQDIIAIDEEESEIGWRSDFRTINSLGSATAGLRVTQIDAAFDTRLGDDWIRYVYRSTDPRPPGQDYIVLTPEAIDVSYAAQEVSYAAFGEQTFDLGAWDVRTGLRYDYDGFSEQSLVSPRLALNWRATPQTRVSATAGVFFQSPRFLDRGGDPDNATLKNERITHFSVGVERDFNDLWSLLVETYYQQLDDLVTETGRVDGRLTNSGTGTSVGADIVLSRSFADGWFGSATYSYNDLSIDDNDGSGEYDGDFSRPHFFTIGGSWEINARWKIGARWKYASGRPVDAFIVNSDVLGPGEPLRFSKELTQRNAQRLDDYHSLNLRIDYRRPIGPVNLVAFLDVINVYGGPGANSQEFNPRSGVNVVEDNGAFPIIGLIFERVW